MMHQHAHHKDGVIPTVIYSGDWDEDQPVIVVQTRLTLVLSVPGDSGRQVSSLDFDPYIRRTIVDILAGKVRHGGIDVVAAATSPFDDPDFGPDEDIFGGGDR